MRTRAQTWKPRYTLVRCDNSDLIGQTESHHAKKGASQIHRWRQFARDSLRGNKADRREPSREKSLWRTAASSGAYLVDPIIRPRPKPFARHSALSAAYASLGWLPAVRFIPCAAYAADKAWTGHDRLESANQRDTRLTVSVSLSLGYYK